MFTARHLRPIGSGCDVARRSKQRARRVCPRLPRRCTSSAIQINPKRPNIVYAEPLGPLTCVLKSTDAGKTWSVADTGLTNPTSPTDSEDLRVDALALDPRSPNVLYAGTGIGVFKTTDAAKTWTLASTGIELWPRRARAPHGRKASIWALAVDRDCRHRRCMPPTQEDLRKATNGGATWKHVLRQGRFRSQSGHRPASARDRVCGRNHVGKPHLDPQDNRRWRQLACDWAARPRRPLLRPPDRGRSASGGDRLRRRIERSLREREPGSHLEQGATTPGSIQRSKLAIALDPVRANLLYVGTYAQAS